MGVAGSSRAAAAPAGDAPGDRNSSFMSVWATEIASIAQAKGACHPLIWRRCKLIRRVWRFGSVAGEKYRATRISLDNEQFTGAQVHPYDGRTEPAGARPALSSVHGRESAD